MKIDFHFPGDDHRPERLTPSDILPRAGEEVTFGDERYRVASISWRNDGPGRIPTAATVQLETVTEPQEVGDPASGLVGHRRNRAAF